MVCFFVRMSIFSMPRNYLGTQDGCYDSLPQPTFQTVLIGISYLESEPWGSDAHYEALHRVDVTLYLSATQARVNILG
jgi:hypothetical protein